MSHRIVLVAAVLGLTVLVGGCGGIGNGNRRPVVAGASVVPGELPFTGGELIITATATDDESVDEVFAVINGAGDSSTLALTLSSDYYGCSYCAPPNLGPADCVYSLEISAVDNLGLVSAPKRLSFTVKAPPAPPQAPPF